MQPLNQPGAHYFHKALPVDNTHYLATVGIGPAGSLGKGSYIVSLMDTDATAAAAITREITGNTLHYNNHGMPPPEGATSTHSIKVIRVG